MKKLALLTAAIVIAVLAVRLWPGRTDAVDPELGALATPAAPARLSAAVPTTPSAAAAPGTSGPGTSGAETSGPYGGTAEARRQWEPTVQGFALAYPDTQGLTGKQWRANLRPYLNRPVLDALA